MFKSLLLASALTMAFSGAAVAQVNQIYNPGFEMGPARPNNNLFMNSNTGNAVGWMDGGGQQLNVVQVDGPGGWASGNNGPESDKTGPAGTTQPRRYLDIANGTNSVFQRFTPKCNGVVKFGAWFTNRAGLAGTSRIRLLQGSAVQGVLPTLPVVATTGNVNINVPNTQFAPWVEATGSANLIAGQTYSFYVDLDNNMNMDEAYLIFPDCNTHPDLPDVPNPTWPIVVDPPFLPTFGGTITASNPILFDPFVLEQVDPRPVNPTQNIDPCCPPFNATILGESLIYKGAGSIGGNYTLEFDPSHTLNGHVNAIPGMQAYLNYLNAINPAINKLNIQLQLYDQGNNQWPINHINASGQSYYAPGSNGTAVGPVTGMTLTAGASTVAKNVNYAPTSNIFVGNTAPGSTPTTYSMVIGRWYMVHSGMWTDRDKFFGEKCANNDYYVRIQAMQKVGQSGYVIQTLDKNGKNLRERAATIRNSRK